VRVVGPRSSRETGTLWGWGLVSPTLEITLPISPMQMLYISGGLQFSGFYVPFEDPAIINNVNKRTRLHAHEVFVSDSSALRAKWF
jgi:hypothetical protein